MTDILGQAKKLRIPPDTIWHGKDDLMQSVFDWLQQVEWQRIVPETLGKALGFLLGFAASWFLLFRRRLQELRRLQHGDSDDILFHMHQLVPIEGTEEVILLFRNIGPRTTVNSLYDNEAARELVKGLAQKTTLNNPILNTESTGGFEVLNDALGYLAGHLAISPFDRTTWLFMMTCEDRQVVRKKCIRCFLIRPDDLARFAKASWCFTRVRVEKPWHAIRVAALHRIAVYWQQEQESAKAKDEQTYNMQLPLIDKQMRHERVRLISVGINPNEKPVGTPVTVDWANQLPRLKALGLETQD